jgi:hypothetical protein
MVNCRVSFAVVGELLNNSRMPALLLGGGGATVATLVTKDGGEIRHRGDLGNLAILATMAAVETWATRASVVLQMLLRRAVVAIYNPWQPWLHRLFCHFSVTPGWFSLLQVGID